MSSITPLNAVLHPYLVQEPQARVSHSASETEPPTLISQDLEETTIHITPQNPNQWVITLQAQLRRLAISAPDKPFHPPALRPPLRSVKEETPPPLFNLTPLIQEIKKLLLKGYEIPDIIDELTPRLPKISQNITYESSVTISIQTRDQLARLFPTIIPFTAKLIEDCVLKIYYEAIILPTNCVFGSFLDMKENIEYFLRISAHWNVKSTMDEIHSLLSNQNKKTIESPQKCQKIISLVLKYQKELSEITSLGAYKNIERQQFLDIIKYQVKVYNRGREKAYLINLKKNIRLFFYQVRVLQQKDQPHQLPFHYLDKCSELIRELDWLRRTVEEIKGKLLNHTVDQLLDCSDLERNTFRTQVYCTIAPVLLQALQRFLKTILFKEFWAMKKLQKQSKISPFATLLQLILKKFVSLKPHFTISPINQINYSQFSSIIETDLFQSLLWDALYVDPQFASFDFEAFILNAMMALQPPLRKQFYNYILDSQQDFSTTLKPYKDALSQLGPQTPKSFDLKNQMNGMKASYEDSLTDYCYKVLFQPWEAQIKNVQALKTSNLSQMKY